MKRKSCLVVLAAAIFLIYSGGISDAWEVRFTDTFDDGNTPLLKDLYIIGDGGADGYVPGEDLFQVSTPPGNPGSGYAQAGVYEQPYLQMVSTVGGYLLLRDLRDGTNDSWTVDKWRYVPTGMGTLTGTETVSWTVTGTPPSGLQLSYSGPGTGSGDTSLETAGTYTISGLNLTEGEGSYGTVTINIAPTAGSISGTVTYSVYAGASALFTFEFRTPGTTTIIADAAEDEDAGTPGTQLTVAMSSGSGIYSLTGLLADTYDVTIKKSNTLREIQTNVSVVGGGNTPNVDYTLRGGDANDDNSVGPGDMFILRDNWGGGPGPADFNGDGSVGPGDMFILRDNWGATGAN